MYTFTRVFMLVFGIFFCLVNVYMECSCIAPLTPVVWYGVNQWVIFGVVVHGGLIGEYVVAVCV